MTRVPSPPLRSHRRRRRHAFAAADPARPLQSYRRRSCMKRQEQDRRHRAFDIFKPSLVVSSISSGFRRPRHRRCWSQQLPKLITILRPDAILNAQRQQARHSQDRCMLWRKPAPCSVSGFARAAQRPRGRSRTEKPHDGDASCFSTEFRPKHSHCRMWHRRAPLRHRAEITRGARCIRLLKAAR
jgi:hypothetical protein